jgi:hypothetical protein
MKSHKSKKKIKQKQKRRNVKIKDDKKPNKKEEKIIKR